MKNKIILAILILSVVALVFSGCGGSVTPDNQPNEIIIEQIFESQSGIEFDTGMGLKVSVPPSLTENQMKLVVNYNSNPTQPQNDSSDFINLHSSYSVSITPQEKSLGQKLFQRRENRDQEPSNATLIFKIPQGVDSHNALILEWTDEGWIIAENEVGLPGGEVDGEDISIVPGHLSEFAIGEWLYNAVFSALKKIPEPPPPTPIIDIQEPILDDQNNLVMEVNLDSPYGITLNLPKIGSLGLAGMWYCIEVESDNDINVDMNGGIYLPPGIKRDITITFPPTSGNASICLQTGLCPLPRAAWNWVSRLGLPTEKLKEISDIISNTEILLENYELYPNGVWNLEGVVWLIKELLLKSFWKLTGSKIKYLANAVPVSVDIAIYITASWFDNRPDPCVEVSPSLLINHPPIISELTANSSSVDINQTTTITCTASDEDVGDTLVYTWTKSGGTFEGSTTGPTITWRAPSTPDNYTVECEVSDGDESDSKSVNIEVTAIADFQYVIQWSTAESNGWANPLGEGEELITSTAYDYNSDIYLNNWEKKHTGTDIIGELDGNVYSIADGTIVKVTRDYSSTSNQSVVIIKHTNSNNEDFFAIYGHVLARSDLEVNSKLEVGEKIGIIKKAGSPVHLHFGINLSSEITDFMFTNSDGEWGWGRIPAFADPSDYGWVDPIDYLNTYLSLASLTPEEIELIGKWGFGGDYIVRRWPDGYIGVYDETNYTRMQDVLQEWNAAIGGPVVFHLSNDPNSPVKVKFDPDLSQDLAGQYLIYCSDDYEFYRADVNIQKNYLDSLNSDTKYCLYLWLFSGVAGFNIQADVDPNPFKEWWNFDKIPDDITTMLHGLYKVLCGYNLLDKKFKENWIQPIVKNLQNLYKGKLYKLYK